MWSRYLRCIFNSRCVLGKESAGNVHSQTVKPLLVELNTRQIVPAEFNNKLTSTAADSVT
jgi:hypothetical protein